MRTWSFTIGLWNLWALFKEWFASLPQRVRIIVFAILIFIPCFIWWDRSDFHPAVLFVREHVYFFTVGIPLYFLFRVFQRRVPAKVWAPLLIVAVIGSSWFIVKAGNPHKYLTLWIRSKTIRTVELEALPRTELERDQPLRAVEFLARQERTGNTNATSVAIIRRDKDLYWTMGEEPAIFKDRWQGFIRHVLLLPATQPSPVFTSVPVRFRAGEKMIGGGNLRKMVVKNLNPWQYCNLVPGDVRYMQDEDGKWVQVVSLSKWDTSLIGWFFPYKVHGGVFVVSQYKGSEGMYRFFFGQKGLHIPADRIKDHAWLRGQSLMPADVSTYMALTVRFQKGFFGPFPLIHDQDVRIPAMPQDLNPQPYITYFNFRGMFGESGGLHDYFALQPINLESKGLNTSVFIPADGAGDTMFVYRHWRHGENVIGPSSVADNVRSIEKRYDWTRNIPVEHRPVTRDVDGDGRLDLLWLTTIVTKVDSDTTKHAGFIAGKDIDLTLTLAGGNHAVVSLADKDPSTWEAQMRAHLTDRIQ